MSKKEKLFSVTASNCKFEYYRGSGPGGQKRNKTSNACRCTHIESGAIGSAEDTRSQLENKQLAFKRMANTKEFQKWAKIHSMKVMGILDDIKTKVKKDMLNNTKVEIHTDKWVETKELAITEQDLLNIDNSND